MNKLENILTEARTLVQDRNYPKVREWKEKGGKSIGCFPVWSPFELYHAGGLLPIGLLGGGGEIEIAHADARFQSFVCSIAKSTLEMGFRGLLEPFDAVVFHSICDVARNLASVVQRNFPDLQVEYIHYPQQSNGGKDFFTGELSRLKKRLEEGVSGRKIRDEDIRESIISYNRSREWIRKFYNYRMDNPHLLSTVELYYLVRMGTLLLPEEYQKLMKNAWETVKSREGRVRDRVKVILEGSFCEQPPVELLEVLELAGCAIVNDDLLSGWRWYVKDVSEEGDPLQNLSEGFLNGGEYSSVRYDPRQSRMDGLIDRMKTSGAQAVVFCNAKFCEPALFDFVLYRKRLEEEEIPHMMIEFEEKQWTFDRVQTEVETFVESILF
jgi:benzoyl-CoA reductase subunit C